MSGFNGVIPVFPSGSTTKNLDIVFIFLCIFYFNEETQM